MAWTSVPKAPSASDVIAIGLMADISMAHCPLRDRSEPGTRAVARNHQLEAQLKTVYNGVGMSGTVLLLRQFDLRSRKVRELDFKLATPTTLLAMSASLIGRLGSSAFRLSPDTVS